jgi:hypothetical protein
MHRKLYIPCPACSGGESKFFYESKIATCHYCCGVKKVDILYHHSMLNIFDGRNDNVKSFVTNPRFVDYLESKNKKR